MVPRLSSVPEMEQSGSGPPLDSAPRWESVPRWKSVVLVMKFAPR